MSCSPDNSYGTTCQPREENFGSQRKGQNEHKSPITSKVACDRCRQRKIKCDRVNPCKQCLKIGVHCAYTCGKAKEKRQRVLISSAYEQRLEDISTKIDELGEIVKRLDERHAVGRANPGKLRLPTHSSLLSSGTKASEQPLSRAEGIESTLFAHVIFTAEALQATVADSPGVTPALDALWTTVNVQKQQNETLERSRPFRKLPPGFNLRDLPIPPMDKIMACLRIAQESSPSQLYWPFEFGSLADFTQYVIKACSPGPITDMELIIVHYGLSWLFTECSNRAGDAAARREYEAQALTCRDSLETIISNLSIHTDTDIVSICAMYMAALHCLHCGKATTAWTLISRASLMGQAIGLHSASGITTEPAVQRKIALFWAVYVLEKSVSLRLGIPSTIRDQDITVQRLPMDRKMASLVFNRMPDWIDAASLYGRVYDNLYSPNALQQPFSVRVSRTNALASELERMMAARADFYNRPDKWTCHVVHPVLSRFIIHANKAVDYSTLASIYRSAPSEKPFSISSSPQCTRAARAAIQESEACISIITDSPAWPPRFDLWANEILLLTPFMPFLILLCNIVESSDSSDLERLQRLIDGLRSLARSSRYSSCMRQLRIFKALYDVVANYVQDKAERYPADLISDDTTYLIEQDWLGADFELWGASEGYMGS
ncbi:hypothetical protein ASPVEDRAFT_89134 [Aspergillus versicolor CBS 583.65]|uniref:Zn(2)-C6 fungal-type domain-containing protein n=1 Tax=Aspergillus versicolor CBS 583.65 TaxID=1036611 RepID=A0A1L9Q2F1_ASPVE|nr:uncharacterized protein ASPVEDRAFT_89134 [Aspergillus versicolor CBS 583.65]OJJ07901.1 hypothetical protein ASPVEDRAFT_89134 [Aspergillus versicolor CBS 583.65]